MTDEIKTIARRHLATDGANLSLRAVARDLGVVSSAIYRYFASRDELLTALILDAYNALGAAVEAADRGVVEAADGRDAAPRVDALALAGWPCHAVRDWALAAPHEYALIYGSPVPGYQAPQDTVPAATRAVARARRDPAGRRADAAGSTPTAEQPLPDRGGRERSRGSPPRICPDVPPRCVEPRPWARGCSCSAW